MARYDYLTLDVFTRHRFGGNPLAVFFNADGLDTATMQALAAEMNYSETTFVLRPDDPANTARVRIFNRTAEMPFAGHPNVGTGFALALTGRASAPVLRFEEVAGLVEVRLNGAPGAPDGAEIDAPQPLQLLGELPVEGIARCLSLDPARIVTAAHPPVRATLGVEFVFVEVAPDALSAAAPDVTAFRASEQARPDLAGRLSIFFYARDGDGVRARMFAPLSGTWEDPATGSANATLAALRLSLGDRDSLSYAAMQGVEMGRPSRLAVRARRTEDGIRASVGGGCVPVFRGSIEL